MDMSVSSQPPFNALRFGRSDVDVEKRRDGTLILRSPQSLQAYPNHLGHHLRRWAAEAPDRHFLLERGASGDWVGVTFRQMLAAVEAIGQAILDRGLSADRPLVVLSENSVDIAMITLGAIYVGVPVAPVSPAYSLLSQDFGKLRGIVKLMTPGMIYAADGVRFGPALKALQLSGTEIVVSTNAPDGIPASLLSTLSETRPGPDVARAYERIHPDHVAKIMFTSGSTGEPKGVITTHRMLCSVLQSISQSWTFLEDKPPVTLDWLPWSHAFGAAHNLNIFLRSGGTMYIDGGRPIPGLIEKTVQNLKEISPTMYFNAPRGFDMLMQFLEKDAELRENFFRRLDMMLYAGAALPQNLWDRLQALSVATRGERTRFLVAWGTTETCCTSTTVYFDLDRAGNIGIPAPGIEIMLTPNGNKQEVRVRGPNVAPGYWKRADLWENACDDEGFYKTGDAGKLADENDPAKGILFDGRVAEDFKLSSGTWVHCSQVRLGAIAACSPIIQDAVVTGHDREDVGLLVFPNIAACRALTGDETLTPEKVPQSPIIREKLLAGLANYNSLNNSNAMSVARVMIMTGPPSIDQGEITDKGYINQRAVRERHHEMVERMYQPAKDELVLRPTD